MFRTHKTKRTSWFLVNYPPNPRALSEKKHVFFRFAILFRIYRHKTLKKDPKMLKIAKKIVFFFKTKFTISICVHFLRFRKQWIYEVNLLLATIFKMKITFAKVNIQYFVSLIYATSICHILKKFEFSTNPLKFYKWNKICFSLT